MSYTVDILQKVRELAVQAANGIYSKENRENMAVEVDELLKELVTTANSRYQDNIYTEALRLRASLMRCC